MNRLTTLNRYFNFCLQLNNSLTNQLLTSFMNQKSINFAPFAKICSLNHSSQIVDTTCATRVVIT